MYLITIMLSAHHPIPSQLGKEDYWGKRANAFFAVGQIPQSELNQRDAGARV
jgi:hypothetical protein